MGPKPIFVCKANPFEFYLVFMPPFGGGMEIIMKKYVCEACGWEYDEALGDPENGIAPGTKFEDLPEDFVCPLCGVGKELFSEA